jgi:WhiB family transcriptional regulator, redox-sensing transcriptional regulator
MTNAVADWRSHGACLSADPELFFPLSSHGPASEQIRRAKSVCARCPVTAQCLEFALSTSEVHGVWGGTDEDQRRRLLARRRAASPAAGARVPVTAGRRH